MKKDVKSPLFKIVFLPIAILTVVDSSNMCSSMGNYADYIS